MKQMVVTGLSNEQDFQTGESKYVLILNKEIRVPVSEELAAQIIQEMYGVAPKVAAPVTDDEGEQQEEHREDEVPSHQAWVGNGARDEDGIDQI